MEKTIQELVQKHTGVKVSLSNSKAIYDELLEHLSNEIQTENN